MPPKIIELRVTGCLFSMSNIFRMTFDGVETELYPEETAQPRFNKLLHVSVNDGAETIELNLVALVNGVEKIVSSAPIPINSGKDFVHYDLTLKDGPITGIVKVAYKTVKLNAMALLRETASGKSVMGISVNTGLVGDGAADAIDYKEIKVKLKDKDGQVLGSNKLSSDKASAFFQLEELEVFQNHGLLTLTFTLEDGETDFALPLGFGTSAMAIPIGPNLALLCTIQLLYQPTLLAGIHHEINMAVLKASGSNEKISVLKGADFAPLLRKNILFFQFLRPDGTLEAPASEASILRAICSAPLDRSNLFPLPDGFFMLTVDTVNGRSQKKKVLLKKNLALHLGTFAISPDLMAEGVAIKCQVSLVSVSCSVDGAGAEMRSVCTGSAIMGIGQLEEKERETSRETGILSVVIEGKLAVSDSEPRLKAHLAKLDSNLSVRVSLSIIPSEAPPLLSPTGELMPMSPPESPRAEGAGPEEDHAVAISPNLGPSNSRKALSIDPTSELAKAPSEGALREEFIDATHANERGELPGQWNLQRQGQDRSMYGGEDIENWGSPGGLGDNGSPVKYKIDRASTALVSMIKSELSEKQRLIDRLVGEASARTDAIELCGREIRTLREEAMRLQVAARDAEAALQQRDAEIREAAAFVEQEVGSPEQLNKLSRTTLVHIACDLGERYQRAMEEKQQLMELVAEAQSARHQMADDKKSLSELQDAHVEQSRLIQKLQKKLAATDTYKSTIKLQERVIAKMQSVIEAHLRTTRSDAGAEGAGLLDRILSDLERRGAEEETSLAQAHGIEAEVERRKKAEDALKAEKKASEALGKQIERLEAELKRAVEIRAASTEPSSLSEQEANRKIDNLEAEVRA